MGSPEQVGAVLNALASALSGDASVRKPAEELLRNNETQTGFASTLLQAMVTPNADPQTRLLAAIYLKNNIQRYWRGVSVSYTHLRAHETVLDLVCRLLLEKKKKQKMKK
eukprot:TRINITY_DN10920_c0_g1_i1.p1 TRINITY_DN10920_c0_g1~~TRINITY_DN10920_c0_g1_i1.p1  ORF type:complete len:110 (-),score=39.84 TRINITY_DN10920_c0_g1_i1:84-413(-)